MVYSPITVQWKVWGKDQSFFFFNQKLHIRKDIVHIYLFPLRDLGKYHWNGTWLDPSHRTIRDLASVTFWKTQFIFVFLILFPWLPTVP